MNGIEELCYFFDISAFFGSSIAFMLPLKQQLQHHNKIPRPKKETIPAIWNQELAPKINEYVIPVDCHQDVEMYNGKRKYCARMAIRDLVIQTEWIECKNDRCEWCEFQRSVLYTTLEEDEFPGGRLMGARDDRTNVGVPVNARPFSSIDTTQQSELDIALNGGPLLPGGGISCIGATVRTQCAMTLHVENLIVTMMSQEYSCILTNGGIQ